ncbi:MAG: CBS domain-containing protein [Candidatus Limnocylindrales bacterium]
MGADRGLKRLSLYRVGDVVLEEAPLVRPDEQSEAVRRRALAAGDRFVLIVDDLARPLGWVDVQDLPAEGRIREDMADPMSPLLDRRDTLKDATSRLLDAEVGSGVVVDRAGRVLGLLTLAAVMDWMRDDRSREVPVDIAEAAAEAVVVAAEEHGEVPAGQP